MRLARTYKIKGSDFHSPEQIGKYWKTRGAQHMWAGMMARRWRLKLLGRKGNRPLCAKFTAANLYDVPTAKVYWKLPQKHRIQGVKL